MVDAGSTPVAQGPEVSEPTAQTVKRNGTVSLSPFLPISLSPLRAWFALIGVSFRRQARMRQMVWVAVGLLAGAVAIVALISNISGWSSAGHRFVLRPPGQPRVLVPGAPRAPTQGRVRTTYGEVIGNTAVLGGALPLDPAGTAVHTGVAGALQAALDQTPLYNFTRAVMFPLFVGFLLPLWCLSFATEALGNEREGKTMGWLLTRPMSRPAIYLAKYISLLPWALGLTVGGFGLMCLAAGKPGRIAFGLYWPAILAATLAFCALFHLFAAWFRRPTVVALVYSFFLETLLGDMPGYMKRVSLSFYTRCLVFDAASDYGLTPEKPTVYLPVSGPTAWAVLLIVTAALLLLGMIRFSRAEYVESE